MKSKLLIVISLISLVGVAFASDNTAAYTPESITTNETFSTKVLKVNHFTEGEMEYLSYTVDWRGHEVIVVPGPGEPRLAEGDAIRCVMRSSAVQPGVSGKSYLTFSTESSARYQSIAASINRRPATTRETPKPAESK